MRQTVFSFAVAVIFATAFTNAAHAQQMRYYPRTQPACATGTCPTPVRYTPAVPVRQASYTPARATYAAAPVQQPAAYGDGPGAFLALLNAERARYGRHPLGWDQNLANWAATNAGVHDGRSSAGCPQCWAPTRSFVHAYNMWRGSGAHWNLLYGAHSAVGVAISATGITANCR